MKKILLIISFVLIIFQMIVLAVDIDIGSPAIDRNNVSVGSYTIVDYNNPANASGKITNVEIWANTTLTDCKVAIFYVVSGTNLTTRDYESIGNVTPGSKQNFPVDLDVQIGDYLGIYFASNDEQIEAVLEGNELYKLGDHIPCDNVTFSAYGETISLYGTGATIGWPHKWNTKEISKWNTKEIIKWNDLE